jgi:hypothetical protein
MVASFPRRLDDPRGGDGSQGRSHALQQVVVEGHELTSAELAVGEAPRLDIGLLSPQRFVRKTAE